MTDFREAQSEVRNEGCQSIVWMMLLDITSFDNGLIFLASPKTRVLCKDLINRRAIVDSPFVESYGRP